MSYLARFVVLIAISISADLGLSQNATVQKVQKNPTKASETAAEKTGEKKADLPGLIFVKADRERIYVLLAEQMKEQEFTLTQKGANRIVFSKRIQGAGAATVRKQTDRRVTTPIIDDPRDIIAFVLVEKDGGYVVGGRMIVTTIINSQAFSFDVSKHKEAWMHLNRILEKLKSDAAIPKITP